MKKLLVIFALVFAAAAMAQDSPQSCLDRLMAVQDSFFNLVQSSQAQLAKLRFPRDEIFLENILINTVDSVATGDYFAQWKNNLAAQARKYSLRATDDVGWAMPTIPPRGLARTTVFDRGDTVTFCFSGREKVPQYVSRCFEHNNMLCQKFGIDQRRIRFLASRVNNEDGARADIITHTIFVVRLAKTAAGWKVYSMTVNYFNAVIALAE